MRLRDDLGCRVNGGLRFGNARSGAGKIKLAEGFGLLFLKRLQRCGGHSQAQLCLGHLAGCRGPLGRQLLDYVEIPNRLVVIDLRFGQIAG